MKQGSDHGKVLEPEVSAVAHGEDAIQLDLAIPGGLAWFEGHFPAAPILPGVVQIDWVLMFGQRYLDIGARVAQSFQVKFRKVFGPGPVRLFIEKRGAETLRFEYRRGEELMSSGSLKLFGEECP